MNAAPDIPITRYPASRGAVWLRESFAMFARARWQWLLLLMLYYTVMAAIDLVPLIGQLVVPILKPVFAVGFLAAAWAQERGGKPALPLLFQGFRSNLKALVPLGVLLLVGITLAIFATALADGGLLLDVLSGRTKVDEGTLTSGSIQRAMLFGALCALPVLLALWYAPALVVFHDCTATRAVVLSLRACVANWRPLLVYGVLVAFYGVLLPAIGMAILTAVLPVEVALPAGVMLTMPYLLLFVATLHISDYVSYRDIFHAEEAAARAA